MVVKLSKPPPHLAQAIMGVCWLWLGLACHSIRHNSCNCWPAALVVAKGNCTYNTGPYCRLGETPTPPTTMSLCNQLHMQTKICQTCFDHQETYIMCPFQLEASNLHEKKKFESKCQDIFTCCATRRIFCMMKDATLLLQRGKRGGE